LQDLDDPKIMKPRDLLHLISYAHLHSEDFPTLTKFVEDVSREIEERAYLYLTEEVYEASNLVQKMIQMRVLDPVPRLDARVKDRLKGQDVQEMLL
jgi:hypothetical protein